jgi:PAS domain S-box-containing protein
MASSVRRVAEILAEAADALIGWDACAVELYSPETDVSTCVLAMDLVDGKRADTTPWGQDTSPSPKLRQVITKGAQIVLRKGVPAFDPDLAPFGDKTRPSASLLFVPIRYERRVAGVFTIQSYLAEVYKPEHLEFLQALADHGGGAIQRLQAEALLRRTEELYRRAIGGADAVPYAYDYRTRSYSFMGERIEQLIGYTPQEVNGQLWSRIIRKSVMLGEAAGLDKKEAARRVAAGELRTWRCDMQVVTRDGTVRWISDASVQNLDEGGRAIGSMGILQDITERKQAELSALAISKLAQALIPATTRLEVAGFVAKAADDLFGWDAFAFHLHLPDQDLIEPLLYVDTIDGSKTQVQALDKLPPTPADRRVIERGPELVARSGAPAQTAAEDCPFPSARPSTCIMRVPVRLASNRTTGIVAIHKCTPGAYNQNELGTLQAMADCCGVALERIEASDALRQSESQFRLVWESSADGMRLTNQEGTTLRVNDAYCRMVDKPRAELEGHLITVAHAPGTADYVLTAYRKRMETNAIQAHLEREVTLWNGRKAWFELSNSLLSLPGRPPLLLSIFRDITQRKADEEQMDKLHRQLLEVSHQAGMAEVATSVLHNVGNVLNSVSISSALTAERIRKSKVPNLAKAAALLLEHAQDLAAFLSKDPKGKQLPGYLSALAEHLAAEHRDVLKELQSLGGNIEHIKEIVAMQQSYARACGVLESLSIVDLVEDALRINSGALQRHTVEVIRDYRAQPTVTADKHKILQILVNLIRNAKYALDEKGHPDKKLVLRLEAPDSKTVRISVIDNGVGIPPAHMPRIFQHGFTTRAKGHGFGLHNGALAAKELGGSLTAFSDGDGKGATFTLELPLAAGKAGS